MKLLVAVTLFASINKVIVYGNLSPDSLVSVVAIFRHGDRAPLLFYPNDPYKNSSQWPEGVAQLTNKGKRRLYLLGKWFRQRYETFLPEKYSPDDILVWSTNSDRTIMSAEALLAGLYPPQGEQVWEQDLKWQPIPIRTKSESLDINVAFSGTCERYNYLHTNLLKQAPYTEKNVELKELYKYVSDNTGGNIDTVGKLAFIFDTLMCELDSNLTLPPWALKVYLDKLRQWTEFFFTSFTYDNDLAKLNTGLFFDDLIKYFSKAMDPETMVPKFQMFSIHGENIVSVLSSLNILKYFLVEYGSSIIFELHRFNGNYYINILYKNGELLQIMSLPNCEVDCPFLKFKETLQTLALSVDDWLVECMLTI